MSYSSNRILNAVISLVFFTVLLFHLPSLAQEPVGGDITSDVTYTLSKSPYMVTESLVIKSGVTLTIQPGVVLKFYPLAGIICNGTLTAKGTESNAILMAPQNPVGEWQGLTFNNSSSKLDQSGNYLSGSVLSNITITRAHVPVTLDLGSSMLIENTTILKCYIGFAIRKSSLNIIRNCKIDDCAYGIWFFGSQNNESNKFIGNEIINCLNIGISINMSSARSYKHIIANNRISGCLTGILIGFNNFTGASNNVIENNYLFNNETAIELFQDSNIIRGNNFENNVNGIFCWKSNNDSIYNNNFSGNTQFALTLTAGSSNNQVLKNNFIGNTGGIWIKSDPARPMSLRNNFFSNTIRNNSKYSFLIEDTPQNAIQFNNIYANGTFRTFKNASTGDIIATENYWGTKRESLIDSVIFDKYDSISRGKVIYKPFFDSLLSNSDQYYSISGRIYAGNSLAPFSQVNLYLSTAKSDKLLRKTIVSADGTFNLPAVLSGDYYLSAIPDRDNLPGYAPTYFYDNIAWGTAEKIKVRANTYDVDINLVKTLTLPQGVGSISGYCASANGICTEVTVLLYDKSLKNIFDWRRVNNGGEFSFSNLPFGEYILCGEKTGIPLFYSQVINLTPTNSSLQNVKLECAQAIYKFSLPYQEQETDGTKLVQVYPNPFTEVLNIDGIIPSGNLQIRLTNSQGVVYNFSNLIFSSSHNTLYLKKLPKGFYMLELWDNEVCLLRKKIVKV